MKIVALSAEMVPEMLEVIKTNPGRIFCRGIFVPCEELKSEDIHPLFTGENMHADSSFAAYENGRLKGFIVAKKTDDAMDVFLLECRRDDNFSNTATVLIEAVQKKAAENSLSSVRIVPMDPVSSGFNIKDDQAIDTLFKMGFWRKITIAAEMRIGLDGWKYPGKMIERKNKLLERGIRFRSMRLEDVNAIESLHERTKTHASWMEMIMDVVKVDPKFVVIATDKEKIIAYSTFFARTLQSSLPEYGPILIDPAFRKMGISSVMMAESLQKIVELGKAREVQLSCYPNKFPIYPRQGFHFTNKYILHATASVEQD